MYLGLQSVFVVALTTLPPRSDFFPFLFIPLSLYAVEVFGRRIGFRWITAYVLAMLGVYVIAEQQPSLEALIDLVMVSLYGALCFFVGQIAHVRQQAEAIQAENQRLLDEL